MATEIIGNIDVDENINENLSLDQSMDEDHSESGTSDSEDGSEEEEVDEGKINELREQVLENPYFYDSHLELVKLLRKGGDLLRLRDARENMSKIFPLTPELWIEWLTDESKLASSEEEKRALVDLFERAIKDYTSVPVWLEYVQFSIGNMGMKDGVDHVRNIFERALTACGLHVTQGALIWEAYREFELVILKTIEPLPGSVATLEQQEQIKQQMDRVRALFKRQLSVPLYDMEKTLEEFRVWNDDEPSATIEQLYRKNKTKLSKLQQFEESLITSAPPHLAEYYQYIEFEEKQGEPSRVQCIYERAVAENCLVPELWQKYTKYLDTKLKIETVVLPVHERAIRNCPWSITLWLNYIKALERYHQSHESINDIIDRALQAGFTQGDEFKQLWMAFLDYLRRRVKWNEDDKEGLQELRDTFQRSIDHLHLFFGTQGDYTTEIFKYWARIEAKLCNNVSRARELWKEILKGGHGAEAQIWLEYFNFERTFGDVTSCRSVLRQGLNSASDWPEAVGEALLNFERQEGTLETLDESVERYERHMLRVKDRRQKKAEKEEKQQQLVEEERKLAKAEKKAARAEKRAAKAAAKFKHSDRESLKRKEPDFLEMENTVKRVVKVDAEGFKIPPIPGMKGQVKSPSKPEECDVLEPEPKRQKLEEKEIAKEKIHGETIEHDPTKDPRTVFISNISYNLEEDRIREFFSEIGEITDLRLVRDYKGRSKGYCYLEFATKDLALEALKRDRMPLEGRPVFVSPCEDKKKNSNKKSFKFATGLEKNKLFIKGLPYSVTEDDLREMFKVFGSLKDVRLVTYRNGNSKGLAYVEYETESAASTAVVKTDGTQLGEHTITVAISNPPERKQRKPEGGKTVTVFKNVLGGGSASDIGPRGRGRTQLSMLPRALQQSQSLRKNKENGEANGTNAMVEEPKKNNEDFRRLLQRN